MDGDFRRYRQNGRSQNSSTFRMGRSTVPEPSAGATNRFRQANTLSTTRGDVTELPQASGRALESSYVGYGYTDTSFQGTSLQQGGQLQPFPQGFLPNQRSQQQEDTPAYPYSQEVAYSLQQQQQQSSAQGSYDSVPQYPARQSVSTIDALSDQFPVPQYFAAGEPTGAAVNGMVSPYMNSQLPHSASYGYPGYMGRSSATAQSFPANMTSLTDPMGTTTGRLEQQQQQQQPSQPQHTHLQPQPQSQPVATEAAATTGTSLDEAYRQFQQALRGILDHSRAGRLVEAGRSLLEISNWLVTNARELGILRDDQALYRDKLGLWNDFNICWLSVFQMQKDLTQSLLQTGHQTPHVSLLDTETMEQMGKELVQLCDRLEEHGLVDYQMGVWEEEILSVLSQCLDVMEYRQGMLSSHPLTATAIATSRS